VNHCAVAQQVVHVCMYVYMCVCVCVCMHTCNECMYGCMYIRIYICMQDRCRYAPGGLLRRSKNGRQKRVGVLTEALPCGSTHTFGDGCAPGVPRVYTSGMASAHVSTSTAAPVECSVCRR